MIDFRYHLVSIVAVFLALAIGLVIGSTALRGAVLSGLNRASAHEKAVNSALYAHNTQLKRQISADDAFARAAETRLLDGLLVGERVVLVLAPGTDSSTVNGIAAALSQAGATVTGEVVLSAQFFDTGVVAEQLLTSTAKSLESQVVLSAQFFDTGVVAEQLLTSTAKSLESLGVALPKSASVPQIAGQQAAARFIAAAIVNKGGLPTLTVGQSQQILSGFGEAGFLQIKGFNGGTSLVGQATMAVVVSGTVQPPKTAGPFNLALVSLTGDLQEASKGALLAGPIKGTGPRSAIDAVNSGAAGIALTTVDNADTAAGQIIVAQALRELLLHAKPAPYGVRPESVPSPAPSASATPSASPSGPAHRTKKKAA